MVSSSKNLRSSDFLWLGGHPAVDFANTRVLPPGLDFEFLQSWQAVVEWLVEAKLSEAKSLQVSKADSIQALEEVRALRNAWKITLEGITTKRGVNGSLIKEINHFLEQDYYIEVLHQTDQKQWSLQRSVSLLKGKELALAILARSIAEFLVIADFKYLRHCANRDSCTLAFYDTTKNHRRQWCSNSMCGNRHKVAEFRRRQRDA
jgi:predicted RNA-binding Zn ribbon-like protein